MIQELKSLLSHSCPNGDLATILKKALPLAIQEIKIKRGLLKRSEVKTTDTKSVEINKTQICDFQNSSQAKDDQFKQSGTSQNNINYSNKSSEKIEGGQGNLQTTEGELKKSPVLNSVKSKKSTSSMKPDYSTAQSISQLESNSQESKKGLGNQPLLSEKIMDKRKITRAIPIELKRKVWKRDGGCCCGKK